MEGNLPVMHLLAPYRHFAFFFLFFSFFRFLFFCFPGSADYYM